jgi:hypothetical protein
MSIKHIAAKSAAPIVIIFVVAIGTGCGKDPQSTSGGQAITDRVQSDKQLLAQLKGTPKEQQAQFTQAHFVQFRHMIDDPDPEVRAQYLQLMKQR